MMGWWVVLSFFNSIVSVPVFILVSTPFASRLNSFAILQVQNIFVVRFLIRLFYSIDPVDGLITVLHAFRWMLGWCELVFCMLTFSFGCVQECYTNEYVVVFPVNILCSLLLVMMLVSSSFAPSEVTGWAPLWDFRLAVIAPSEVGDCLPLCLFLFYWMWCSYQNMLAIFSKPWVLRLQILSTGF